MAGSLMSDVIITAFIPKLRRLCHGMFASCCPSFFFFFFKELLSFIVFFKGSHLPPDVPDVVAVPSSNFHSANVYWMLGTGLSPGDVKIIVVSVYVPVFKMKVQIHHSVFTTGANLVKHRVVHRNSIHCGSRGWWSRNAF